ncbi:MAG: ABC transporter permease [Geminicoccaceae bacterium]|nr:ABC transporter permease [Geminicoccaceae bacterium]MCB9943511.1 ABC transporter permease [Geminicoccaceae bacterium]
MSAADTTTDAVQVSDRYLKRSGVLRRARNFIISAASVFVFFAVWTIIANSGVISPTFLPSPAAVWASLVDAQVDGYRGHTLAAHVAYSLFRVFSGFTAAIVIGVPVGLMMGRSDTANAIIDPFVQFFRPLPPLGYYMLLVLWFGIGEMSKVVLLFLTGFPVMVVSAAAAVRSVQESHLRVARSLGLSERQVFWSVIFPSTLPALFTAARLTIGVTFGSLVAAEIVAASRGVGFIILNSSQYLRTEYVFMGIFVIGAIALLLDKAASAIERVVVPWAGKG